MALDHYSRRDNSRVVVEAVRDYVLEVTDTTARLVYEEEQHAIVAEEDLLRDPADSNDEPALFTTPEGGLAVLRDGRYFWHSDVPSHLHRVKLGDPIPGRWSLTPANNAAEINAQESQRRRDEDLAWAERYRTPPARSYCHVCGNQDGGCVYCNPVHP
jgi:hypothetical protein